jgi:hypothetical protein
VIVAIVITAECHGLAVSLSMVMCEKERVPSLGTLSMSSADLLFLLPHLQTFSKDKILLTDGDQLKFLFVQNSYNLQ